MSEHEGSIGRFVDMAESRDRRRTEPGPGELLGTFIKLTRQRRRLSQARAAEMSAVSKTTWQQIESGAGETARNATLYGIARALEVDAAVLLGLRDGMTTLVDAQMFARSRADVMANIERLLDEFRLGDLYAIEEQVQIRAELRRLQRGGATGENGSH